MGDKLMTDYVSPTPTGLRKDQVFQLAEKFAKAANYEIGKPIQPIVENFGGKIIYQDIEDWYNSESGSIIVDSKNDFKIYISNFSGPLRNRFTIAHELGHYILHSEFGKKKIKVARFTDSETPTDRVEWEANWFAAGLLMPEQEFKNLYAHTNNIDFLASQFLVSPTAVQIRIKELGL